MVNIKARIWIRMIWTCSRASEGGGRNPANFIGGCSAQGQYTLPFHIPKFGEIVSLVSHTKFQKSATFHILNSPKRYSSNLSHTSSLKKGPLSHTWSPKRYPFRAEHPHIVHHREYPTWLGPI